MLDSRTNLAGESPFGDDPPKKTLQMRDCLSGVISSTSATSGRSPTGRTAWSPTASDGSGTVSSTSASLFPVGNSGTGGVIEECSSLRFQARLFLVPKKDTQEKRVIFDLLHLNQFIRCDRSKMMTVSQMRILLPGGAFTCSLALSNTYWHITVAPGFRTFLVFVLGRKLYLFKAMPFSLNIAPGRIFTKLINCVVKVLHLRGVQVVASLDDRLVWAPTKHVSGIVGH